MDNSNYSYFVQHISELYKEYAKKMVVISNNNVVGAFDSYKEAFLYVVKNHVKEGDYIIQESVENIDDNSEMFYSLNVSFK